MTSSPLTRDEYELQLDVYRGDLLGVPISPNYTDMRYYYAGEGTFSWGEFTLGVTDEGSLVDFWSQPREIPIRMSPIEYLDGVANVVQLLGRRRFDPLSQALVIGALRDYLASIGANRM